MADNGAYMASCLLSLQTSENDNEIYAGIDEHVPPTPRISSAPVEHATPRPWMSGIYSGWGGWDFILNTSLLCHIIL